MNTRRHAIVRDLVEEAKKRLVVLAICVVGLSYLMSLTSSSVLVNLPAAAVVIIFVRYFALDYEMRKKAASYSSKTSDTATSKLTQTKHSEVATNLSGTSDWRKNINSPVVEEAVDHFSRRLVSEWVTDLWYSKLTPDLQGPEELVLIINSVIGELSRRFRNINLIDLLTRDLIGVICLHLERFRSIQLKFDRVTSESSFNENIDDKIRLALAADDKLHPSLYSDVSQHKVLQHVMENLLSLVCRSEDIHCSLFRYVSRELLASTIMRPVLNMATPRFINERIEIFVLSKRSKAPTSSEEVPLTKSEDLPPDDFTNFSDPTGSGVELVQLKNDNPKGAQANGDFSSRDPLLSMSTRSSHSWNSLPLNSQISTQGVVQRHQSAGEWGEILDIISQRKTAALAPENFEIMWSKGRNHGNPKTSSTSSPNAPVSAKRIKPEDKDPIPKNTDAPISIEDKSKRENHLMSYRADAVVNSSDDSESHSSDSSVSSEADPCNVTGIDSPVKKVWDRKNNRNPAVTSIHHPLETPVSRHRRKIVNGSLHFKPPRSRSIRKRNKANSQKGNAWQEVERTSFLSGDGQDILRSNDDYKGVDASSGSDVDIRISSGATTSSSASFLLSNASTSLSANSFFKLKCEVLGANIVKSDSKTFAVYSISVNDSSNNSWSIKRRFRHFEELHRRLKEYSEYDLHLPPKHFLSGGLDVYVIQERCQLLDRYLKKVLELPTISGSIEVWDFLSVDSQTYFFTSSFSVVETLPVNLEDNVTERNKKSSIIDGSFWNSSPGGNKEQKSRQHKGPKSRGNISESDINISGNSRAELRNTIENSLSDSETQKIANKDQRLREGDHSNNSEDLLPDSSGTPFPVEVPTFVAKSYVRQVPFSQWVPPNITLPILDLVDVILQLHDGGWIRRKAFWVVKQILQLGMGDALDDWVLDKIQLLRKGSVIASIVERIETILWPDGIFITKHPKRRAQEASNTSQSPNASLSRSPTFTEEQQLEADRRAKLVYELMIDKAPAAVVGLVGRKEYEHCAKDLYLFIQSAVCLKLLALDILELVITAAFPEMNAIFQQIHEEKLRFGHFIPSSTH